MVKKECHRDSEIAVLQNNHSSMAEDIKEAKNGIKELNLKFDSFKDFISEAFANHTKEADMKYATKVEHKDNVDKIESLEKSNKDNLKVIIGTMFAIILSLIWVIWSQLHNIVK